MVAVPNRAYMSVWLKEFPEDRILERFGEFLATVPFSSTKPGFTQLVIRAVDLTETPILEQDLRAVPHGATEVVEIAKNYLHSDSSYEVRSDWDLWVLPPAEDQWKLEPQPLDIFCHGEDFDDSFWQENGHMEVDFGFEHFFTGHAGLLGTRHGPASPPESPLEARLVEMMAWPENLATYQEKTRENIRKVLGWVQRIEKALPVKQLRLWSEGEENFEARLEEILAVR
jgi:hypothetical protein